MANIEEKVEKLIELKINELGYKLYDVEYQKEGKDYFLRIFIDRKKRNRFKMHAYLQRRDKRDARNRNNGINLGGNLDRKNIQTKIHKERSAPFRRV